MGDATKAPRKARGKRADLAAWIERRRPSQIGEPEWQALLRDLAPVSESYLRRLMRECAIPLTPAVEGVRQDSFEALERTLLNLLDEYQRGDAARRAMLRSLVITAKDHARWASKQEMTLWLRTWLENPPLFPDWVRLRRAAVEKE